MTTHNFLVLVLLSSLATGCANTANTSVATTKRPGAFYQNDGPIKGVTDDQIAAIEEPVPELLPLSRGAMKPYTIRGTTYTPMTKIGRVRDRGQATWYGSQYQGRRTSNGEIFDAMRFTAAHTTLPLPSFVRVTNLSNGRTLIVRVNDRGPFLKGRIIDLSYAAARRLGFASSGSAEVEIESIVPR